MTIDLTPREKIALRRIVEGPHDLRPDPLYRSTTAATVAGTLLNPPRSNADQPEDPSLSDLQNAISKLFGVRDIDYDLPERLRAKALELGIDLRHIPTPQSVNGNASEMAKVYAARAERGS